MYTEQVRLLSLHVIELMEMERGTDNKWSFRTAFSKAFRDSHFGADQYHTVRLGVKYFIDSYYHTTKTRLSGSEIMARQAHEDVCPIH